jgi:hypothetical protein
MFARTNNRYATDTLQKAVAMFLLNAAAVVNSTCVVDEHAHWLTARLPPASAWRLQWLKIHVKVILVTGANRLRLQRQAAKHVSGRVCF